MTRLRPFNEPENVSVLLALPQELMRQAQRHRNFRRGAVRAQLAVAIEILLMAPIRMRNLVNLDIEQILSARSGAGRCISSSDPKTSKTRKPSSILCLRKALLLSIPTSRNFGLIWH